MKSYIKGITNGRQGIVEIKGTWVRDPISCTWVQGHRDTKIQLSQMLRWHGKAFCITGHLWGESTGQWQTPLTNVSNADFLFEDFFLPAAEQTFEQIVESSVIRYDRVLVSMSWKHIWFFPKFLTDTLQWPMSVAYCRSKPEAKLYIWLWVVELHTMSYTGLC